MDERITFTLPTGTQITAPKQLAEQLGWKPEPTPDEPRSQHRN